MSRYSDPDDGNRPPEDLTSWLRAGLRRTEALAWRQWNFSLAEALRWRAGGVGEALTAAQWQAAGVGPSATADWLAAGIDASEAVHWHELGFNLAQAREHKKKGRGPEQAFSLGRSSQQGTMVLSGTMGGTTGPRGPMGAAIEKFHNAGVPQAVLGSYLHTQWFDDAAVDWAREGIPAWNARLWHILALTPAEAAEMEKAGLTPQEVIRQWWQAGIPFDEVADWLGAGLSAQEAAEQRAAGVTVDQAAALRALRRGGAL